jgi:hypothetical protein
MMVTFVGRVVLWCVCVVVGGVGWGESWDDNEDLRVLWWGVGVGWGWGGKRGRHCKFGCQGQCLCVVCHCICKRLGPGVLL